RGGKQYFFIFRQKNVFFRRTNLIVHAQHSRHWLASTTYSNSSKQLYNFSTSTFDKVLQNITSGSHPPTSNTTRNNFSHFNARTNSEPSKHNCRRFKCCWSC
uniref:Ovule protein n=1 Tax=Meloidogyne incognita TaxID=6306 RepID=A0A914NVD0_MELIC